MASTADVNEPHNAKLKRARRASLAAFCYKLCLRLVAGNTGCFLDRTYGAASLIIDIADGIKPVRS
jgi:hypothetical protein